eukprot:UN0071
MSTHLACGLASRSNTYTHALEREACRWNMLSRTGYVCMWVLRALCGTVQRCARLRVHVCLLARRCNATLCKGSIRSSLAIWLKAKALTSPDSKSDPS